MTYDTPASLRSDPGRLAPERVAVIPPDWAAEITGIRKQLGLECLALLERW